MLEGDALGPRESLHPELEREWSQAEHPPRLVANLPYAISGPFLGRLPGRALAGATLLLQREVAEKAAGAVDGEWSPLSLRLALAFMPTVGRRVPAEVFWPRPQIESAFLHLLPRADAPAAEQLALLVPVLRAAFGQRRKRLLPRLERDFPEWAAALILAGVGRDERPGELTPAHWLTALRELK